MNSHRVAAAAIATVLVVASSHAQAPAPEAAPAPWTRKTPDGQPDLQGTWVNFDGTPFEADSQAPSLFGNPLDGRPHVGANIRLWNGDARGRWEGNTLVVETTNFNDKGVLGSSAATGRIRGIPHSEEMRVVERFTRIGEDVINYSATITDPKVYTAPWTVALPLNRDSSYVLFEYGCHEGNLAMPNALNAGRVRERAAKQQ